MGIVTFLEYLEQFVRRYWPIHGHGEFPCQESPQDVLALHDVL